MRTSSWLVVAVALSLACNTSEGGAEPGSAESTGGSGSGGETTGAPATPENTTAADTTGGDESSSGSTTGDSPVDEPCGEGPWTCLPVPPGGPYGSMTFEVPAAQNWVNTGLFMQAGDTATISEEGSWFVNINTGDPIDHGPCFIGDLVARIGLHYKDPALTCVDGEVVFTADKDGILFVGGLPENDLGETYEARVAAEGFKTVTVTSDGATVPTVESVLAAEYPFDEVASGWVEIRGDHVLLTLPTSTAGQDAAALEASVAILDEIYELEEELRGALPQHGQRIRFFPDPDVTPLGYMLAGNPVRMQPVLVQPDFSDRISLAGMPGVDIWGFAHELGHDFTFAGRLWWYQENSLESWPNLFSIYALEALGVPLHEQVAGCPGSEPVAYEQWDAWDGLCFLLQFQYTYDWAFYQAFFAELNAVDPVIVPSGPLAWTFNHDRFETIAGEDITPVFEAWAVPNPG
ncbi:MAG: M60 family metallopeptidase [Myxococcota bacterium]